MAKFTVAQNATGGLTTVLQTFRSCYGCAMRRRPRVQKATRVELDPLVIPYLEAYPVIAIKALKREYDAHRYICEWVSGHIVIGEMTVDSLTKGQLTISYTSGANTYKRSTETTFHLSAGTKRNGASDLRVYCLGCKNAVDRIYLRTERWVCRTCHGLTDKHRLYGYRERLITRRSELIMQLYANWSPHTNPILDSMRRQEFREIEQELDETGGPFMDEPYCHKVVCSWHRDDGDREGLSQLRTIPEYLDSLAPLKSTVAKRAQTARVGRIGGRWASQPARPKMSQTKRLIMPYLPPDD